MVSYIAVPGCLPSVLVELSFTKVNPLKNNYYANECKKIISSAPPIPTRPNPINKIRALIIRKRRLGARECEIASRRSRKK